MNSAGNRRDRDSSRHRIGRSSKNVVDVDVGETGLTHQQKICAGLAAPEFFQHFIRGRVTIVSFLGGRFLYDGFQISADAKRREQGQRSQLVLGSHLRPEHRGIGRIGSERSFPCEHLAENNAGRIYIGAQVAIRPADDSLRRHISRGAKSFTGQREVLASDHLGDAEVEYLDAERFAVLSDDDIFGLEVAMYYAVLMGVAYGFKNLNDD